MIKQLNAMPPITYSDTQTTKVFTATPAHDIEKLSVSKTGGKIEFWSDDSLDGMARESLVNVAWSDVCCHNIYVANDPKAGADYQVQVFTSGGYVIQNSYRDVDDDGHLAPEQKGAPANMFSFDNQGDFAKAKHVADLLTTLVTLAAGQEPAPVPVAAQPPADAPDALAAASADQPDGEMKLTVATMPPAPAAAAVGASYFEGPFAVRVAPSHGGIASVDVVNISSQTHKVNISVVNCQNIASEDCGSQFNGKLTPGMKLSFLIHNDDVGENSAFQVDAAAHDEMVAEITPQTATH